MEEATTPSSADPRDGGPEGPFESASFDADAGAEDPQSGSLMRAAPGLMRIFAAASWNAAGWTVGASVRSGSRVMRAAASGESPAEFLQEAGAEVRRYARELLGVLEPDGDARGAGAKPPPPGGQDSADRVHGSQDSALRAQGAELLRRSADVHLEEEFHPAYARILEDLAPDEARVLRLLAEQGPQPAVDVRSGLPLVASELVALGLTMIGAEAGCRYPDRVHAYLNNLYRLGLVWFSREPVSDRLRYQVLEAQPDVAEAMREAGRLGRTVRRSIHLTPFGEDFCKLALPLETADVEALPGEGRIPGAGPPPEGGAEPGADPGAEGGADPEAEGGADPAAEPEAEPEAPPSRAAAPE